MFQARRAARIAREFVTASRSADGGYDIGTWPEVGARTDADPSVGVVVLREAQRKSLGFLDAVDDALYLTAGLRALGHDATFHLGRELVPAKPPGGFHPWVECGGDVVSTSLAVQEEYVEVHRAPRTEPAC